MDPAPPSEGNHRLPFRCLSLDLEVGRRNGLIRAFAGVRSDTGRTLVFPLPGADLATALSRMDDLADGTEFVLGHNLIAFDLPHLKAVSPGLRLLRKPAIDTLRLNPLAFPRNPYHSLVKHYQDGQLRRGRINDPELDARETIGLLGDQLEAFRGADPGLLAAWHWLTVAGDGAGFDALFSWIRGSARPSDTEGEDAVRAMLAGNTCRTRAGEVASNAGAHGWALAYALAWLSVSGGNSVISPWVLHNFPGAEELVRLLRDRPCVDPACGWCRDRHDARRELDRWFGFPGFRPEPLDEDSGRPMQQSITEAAMRGEHVLGILPTGAGKSVCYQVPALSRYDKTGGLTVVISPLVALMADQVDGLRKRGISSCVTINGLLPMPERADALDQVRLGDAGILIISPEQLRSATVRRALAQRGIAAWVLDEAHCLSKWGHDFRPDYRYIGRFVRERAGKGPVPPVLCLTATAKPDVKTEIIDYFKEKLDIDLRVFDGGAERKNLRFDVVATSGEGKFAQIHDILTSELPADEPGAGGAIIYCATRRQAEEVARYLQAKGTPAKHFHAGLPPETKKDVQRSFIDGELQAIAATNAFGMGIDKPDVRLVIHADIPGSLENYLQEAGRAGRDRQAARCVLLYTPDDVERQFGMSARSRLTRREIQGVLKALWNLDRKKRLDGEVIATAGEILREDEESAFERDSATDDTRVKTAVAWLEDAVLLSREENLVQVFPASLQVKSLDDARARLVSAGVTDDRRRQLLAIVEKLMEADADEGISTDELMNAARLTPEEVRAALHDLETLGIASNDTALTAFVHAGVEDSSQRRFEQAAALEHALIGLLRESAPDMDEGESWPLHLREANQRLKDEGHSQALPERVWQIVRSIAADGQGQEGGRGSLGLRRQGRETVQVTLQRGWTALERTAELRREAAGRLLDHLLACLPRGRHGKDLQAATTQGKLLAAINADLVLGSEARDPVKLMGRALMWLHEQEVIRLHKGLAVFRSAMTIRIGPERRRFTQGNFEPLKLHYDEQVLQIHVMAEFAQQGLGSMADAVHMAMDYFSLPKKDFLQRWLPDRGRDLLLQTTPESWTAIVESLGNQAQRRIVTDDREQANVLVLAGPGSGKTRVLVHRIAHLIRVRREDPRGILALAFNRHAAVEIRRRLADLIGDDARGVMVLTHHALAMRLVGASFAGRANRLRNVDFDDVLRQAVALLRGEGLPPDEADESRERLLAGFRWILVDEYQDINQARYELISALAGRTLPDEDDKLSLFAVGDDDQNVYAYDGASSEFIRRFEEDYGARPVYLTDNYRSSGHIVAAANAVIEPARRRMKAGHPIRVDRNRVNEAPGGAWAGLDPVARGRVQLLPAGDSAITQAQAAVAELQRLSGLGRDWDWSACAVVARDWRFLDPVRSLCEAEGIPVQMANEDFSGFWHLRETRAFVRWLRGRDSPLVEGADLDGWVARQPHGPWTELLQEAVSNYALESGGSEVPVEHFVEWLAEWGRETRRRQRGLLLLTAHRAKGLEFDHVVVLDGGWDRVGRGEDQDAPRRLYYVAMTRARQTLSLATLPGPHPIQGDLAEKPSVLRRHPPVEMPSPSPGLARNYRRLSLRHVFLSFAGYRSPQHSVHQAITALSPGDQLQVRLEPNRWQLLDQQGVVVGQLAGGFEPPDRMRCVGATVFAIATWDRERSEPEYRDALRCDSWEVVVPELIFEPDP